MFKCMEPQEIVNNRQGINSETTGYIHIDVSVVHVAHP